MDPQAELLLESLKRYEAARKEAWSKRDVEEEERWKKIDEEPLEFDEWRKRDVVREEVDRKYDAEEKKLQMKCKAEIKPFQVNQIIKSSIPKVLIQKVASLQVASKRTALKVHFNAPKFQVKKLSPIELN